MTAMGLHDNNSSNDTVPNSTKMQYMYINGSNKLCIVSSLKLSFSLTSVFLVGESTPCLGSRNDPNPN